jgi:hypothetical protein
VWFCVQQGGLATFRRLILSLSIKRACPPDAARFDRFAFGLSATARGNLNDPAQSPDRADSCAQHEHC